MRLGDCHNFYDFRALAKRRLPGPIFDYIDGAADDEVTLRQNAASFERCDLVPNVLRGVGTIEISVTVMGQKLAMPVYCSPTALQRLFHHQGERAVAAAAAKFGTMFGVSSLGTVSLEELRKAYDTPQVYQFYFHKDRALNRAMMQRAKDAGVNIMMLTVDSITGGIASAICARDFLFLSILLWAECFNSRLNRCGRSTISLTNDSDCLSWMNTST
jgi:L-lactate dehydrogenase (cytochrome)